MKNFGAISVVIGTLIAANLPAAERANSINAVVHDSIVTWQEVEIPAVTLTENLRRKYANQPELYERELAKVRDENTEQLVERELILHEFVAAGYSFPETYVEEQVQDRIRREFLGDRSRLIKTLQAEGITYEKFRQQTRERMILRVMTDKFVNREIVISPTKIEAYYLAHKDDYKMDEQIKLRMIVLNTPSTADRAAIKQRAQEILSQIKAGATFAEMADVNSDSKAPGGDRGWIQKVAPDGKPVLRDELSNVAFNLKPGEVSDIIETPEAFYLLLVEDKRQGHVKSLAEVRERIENEMVNQEHNRLRKEWIERLRKKTFVRYF